MSRRDQTVIHLSVGLVAAINLATGYLVARHAEDWVQAYLAFAAVFLLTTTAAKFAIAKSLRK